MSLLTYEGYVALTGDTTTAASAVEAMIPNAETAVAEFLRRPGRLEFGTYTDRLHVDVDGRVYPKAIPVSSVTATGSNVQVIDPITVGYLYPYDFLWEPFHDTGGCDSYLVQRPVADVTYEGGWTADNLPWALKNVIAQACWKMLYPTPLDDPFAGANSVSVGDARVSWSASKTGPAAGRSQIEALVPGAEATLGGWMWSEDYA